VKFLDEKHTASASVEALSIGFFAHPIARGDVF
jgi:hypothetical protein